MNHPNIKEVIAKEIIAREIIDSRGFPTVEVELMLEPKFLGRAAVPKILGQNQELLLENFLSKYYQRHWSLEMVIKTYFLGKGVKHIKNINQIITPIILGLIAKRTRSNFARLWTAQKINLN